MTTIIHEGGSSLSPDQHVRRRGFIGGSDAPRILGVSPYGGPLQVYEEKMGLAERPPAGPGARWGSILEAPVAHEYARVRGYTLRARKRPAIHPKHPFIGGYIDRYIVGHPGIYEGKTGSAFAKEHWGEPGSDEIPDDYWVQVQHYMAVTGRLWCEVATLLGGSDFRIYHVDRNDAFIVQLIEAERTFWHDHVEKATPPPVSGTEADRAYLHRRYPADDGIVIPATPEDEALIRALVAAKADVKVAESRLLAVENDVKDRIADNAGLAGAAGVVTWKSQNSNRADWKSIAHEWKNLFGLYVPAEHWEHLTREGNAIAQRHTTTSTIRVLRIKGATDAE